MDIYCCTSEVMEIHLKYFIFFPCFWRIKLLNNLKNQNFFWQFQVIFHMFGTYVMYLNIGKTMTMIIMTEILATKITINNLRIPLCRHDEIRKGSQKYGQRTSKNCEKVHV